jgi:Rha family phage regulatory protein
MAELVIQNSNGNDVTTSLIVAQVFGKEHNKVVRDIENLSCSSNFNAANFGVIEYTDSRGRIQKAYEMTKDGFSFLVMGYTGAKAGEFKERFINEFNKRELMLKDDDYILMRSQQILQKRVGMAEQKVRALEEKNALQDAQLRQAAPKVKYVDEVLQSVNTYTSTQIAKEIGMDAAKFHKALKERKVMFYQSGTWMLTAKYQGKGYTKMRTHQFTRNDGSVGTNSYTVFTEKGRAMIHNIFGGNPSDGKLTRIF